jgi:gliding motility-associated-like protein
MKRILLLWLLLSGALAALAQPCGLNDTLLINNNSSPTFNYEVFNIFNDDLSDPDQGICGVEIYFLHQFIDNLEIALTSPAGQTVNLIGPNTDEQFTFTPAARWRITFVSCSDLAAPDPGFLPQWNNNQPNNFVAAGQYSGSYYPYQGCLEDFNTGPVNGTWSIEVTNNPSNFPGAILGFRLLFCDERGLDCCFAASGNMDSQQDVLTCVGDSSLLFDEVEPIFNGTPPDSNEYGYTYLIAEDSILLEYDSVPDLTGRPPGLYQICGISFKREDRDSFPDPDGSITIDSIRTNLDGLLPEFCGEVTDTCIWVEILPLPDTTFLTTSICEGDSIIIGDSTILNTGAYIITLPSFADCDSIVSLDLNVIATENTFLTDTICEGDSVRIGNSIYTQTGISTDTLLSAQLCDSIVTLDLTVIPPIVTPISETICAGEEIMIGDSTLSVSGNYDILLTSSNGCDSLVIVELLVLAPLASISMADSLSCSNQEVSLDGSSSTPPGQLSYQWLNISEVPLGSAAVLNVQTPGSYILEVRQQENGRICTNRDTIVVVADTLAPIADAGLPDTLNCIDTLLTLGGAATSTGPEYIYGWSTNGGNISGPADVPIIQANLPGLYSFIVTDTTNGCADTSAVQIEQDIQIPVADAGADTSLSCIRNSLELDGSVSSQGPSFTYEWISGEGVVPVNPGTLSPTVTQGGTYRLLVRDTTNGCLDSAFVDVVLDTLLPVVSILAPDTLNCTQTSLLLSGSITDAGSTPDFIWQPSNGGNILQDANTLMPLIDAPGTYTLIATNIANGCQDSASVTVAQQLLTVSADAGPTDTLTCATPVITLDGSSSTTAPGIVYAWSTDDGQLLGDGTSITAEAEAAGTYQLIVLDTTTQCADTASVLIAQDTIAPIADAGLPRTITCDSSCVTLDASNSSLGDIFSYDWLNVTQTGIVTSGTLYPEICEAGTYLLLVTNNDNGCLDTSFVQVGIDTLPPLVMIETPDILNCAVQSVQLRAEGSDSGADFSILWSATNGGTISQGANTLNPTATSPGTYTLSITNELTGCVNSSSVAVVDTISQLTAGIEDAGPLTCDNPTLLLDTLQTTAAENVIYCWSTDDGTILGDTIGNSIEIAQAGTYYLTVKDTFTECLEIDSILILADTIAPLAEAGEGFELNCSVLQDTLFATGSATGPNIIYEWTGPCILSGTDANQSVVDCAGTYYLEVTDVSNGCSAVDSVLVTQDESIPIADVGEGYVLTCDSLVLTLDASASSQGNEYVYQWAGPAINSGAASLFPLIAAPGLYTLSVTDTVNTCQSTASVLVSQDTIAPIADAGEFDVLNCDSLIVEIGGIETSVGPEFAYEWTTEDGNFASATGQAFVLVDSAGSYQLEVINLVNGCRDTAQTTVFDNTNPPMANAGPDVELNCSTPDAILGDPNAPTTANLSYLWSGPCIDGPTDSTTIHISCEGDYILTVSDSGSGCSNTDTVSISRDNNLPVALLPDSLNLSCQDGTVLIDASSSSGSFFSWLFEGAPTSLSGLTPIVDTSGVYTLIAENASQDCADTSEVIVLLDCTPVAAIAAPDTLTCSVQSVVLDGSNSESGDSITYNWLAPAGNCIVSGQGTSQVEVLCSGVYSLIVTNTAVGLSDTAFVTVSSDTIPPLADAGPSDTLTCDDPVALLDGSGSTQGSGIGYLWTQLEDELFSNDSLQATTFVDGTYFFTVIDSLTGCVDEDIVVIQKSDDLPDVSFNGNVIPCLDESYWLEATVEPQGPDYQYSWAGDVILGASDSAAVLLDTAGFLTLTVVNPANNCTVYRNINVVQQQCIPCLDALPADSLTCAVDTVALNAFFCEPCEGCTIQWSSPSGTFLSPTDSLNVLVGAPGTYTLTAFDTLGFSETLSIVVIENTTPPPANAGPDQQLECDLLFAGLGVAPPEPDSLYSYTWTAASGAVLATDSLPAIQVDFPDTFQLEVTNNITGCVNTDEVIVTINTLAPDAEAGDSAMLTCTNPNVALDGSESTFGNDITYFWEGPEGSNIAGQMSFNPVVNNPGWYFLTVTDTLTGCFSVDSVLVIQDASLPPVPALQDTALNCGSDIVLLTGEVPAGDEYSFCWNRLDNNGNPTPPCVEMLTIPVSIPGNYQFEITNNNNNCSNSITVNVGEDYDPPSVDAGSDMQLPCDLDSLQLFGSAAPDSAVFSYNWSALGGSVISNTTSANPFIYNADDYVLTATNLLNQCTAMDTVSILLDDAAPTADAGTDSSLTCLNTTIRLEGQQQTVSGQSDISWQSPDGSILLDGNTLNPLVDAAGIYILTVTDLANGCTDQDTVSISSNTTPPTAAILDNPLEINCLVDSVLVDGTASFGLGPEGLSYNWRRPPFGTISQQATVLLGSTGNYSLVVTDSVNGCRDTLLFTITNDFETPDAAIAPPDEFTCEQDTILLDGSNSTGGPGIRYLWINSTGDTLPVTTPVITVGAPGEYWLQVINEDNGCLDSINATVASDTIAPQVEIASPDPLDCIIRTSTLDGSSSSSGGAFEYQWQALSMGGILMEGQNTPISLAGAPGWYALQILNTRNGCTNQDSVEVVELASPISEVFLETSPPSCLGRMDASIRLDSVMGGTPPFLFSLDGGPFTNQTNYENVTPGSYEVSIEDSNGCTWDGVLNVPEADSLSISLTADASIIVGQQDTLLATISTPAWDSIWWWPEDGIPLEGQPLSYVVAPSISNVYSVWVSTGDGCIATASIYIQVEKGNQVYAPTIFSPDGNGNNDFYTLFTGEEVASIQVLQIYDRWGNMVFENSDFPPNEPSLGWDGNFNGSPMDPAVFAFHAELVYKDGRVEILKGDFVLMR